MTIPRSWTKIVGPEMVKLSGSWYKFMCPNNETDSPEKALAIG